MTTNQLIAMLFPLATVAAAAITGLLVKKIGLDGSKGVAYVKQNGTVDDVLSALNEAERAIQQAELRVKASKPSPERPVPQP